MENPIVCSVDWRQRMTRTICNAIFSWKIHSPLSILNTSRNAGLIVDQRARLLVELPRQTADEIGEIRRRRQRERPPRNVSVIAARDDIRSREMQAIDERPMRVEYPDQPRGGDIPESNGAVSCRRRQDRLTRVHGRIEQDDRA